MTTLAPLRSPSHTASLILSAGDRQLDLVGAPPTGIFLLKDGWSPPLVAAEHTWAESADSEGRRRLRSRNTNPEGSVRLAIAAATEAEFWDYVDDLEELIAAAHASRGTLRYVPPRNGAPVTLDLEAVELTSLPQDGVMLDALVIAEAEFKFECRPWARLDPVTIFTGESIVGPVGYVDVADVPGHVDAWGELTLTDDSSERREHLEVGIQVDYDPDNPEPLALGLPSYFVLEAEVGIQGSRADSWSADVVTATMTESPTVLVATTALGHKGAWKVRARLYPEEGSGRVRLGWRVGDGPITREGWVTLPGAGNWFDVDLGSIDIPELTVGHSFTAYLEGAAAEGTVDIDIDFLCMIPARYGRARAQIGGESVASYGWRDGFDQSAGALTGKSPTQGAGSYSGALGDTNDFTVDATNRVATRTAVSDSGAGNIPGRLVVAGSTIYTDVEGAVDFRSSATGHGQGGIVLRHTDVDNTSWWTAQGTAAGLYVGGAYIEAGSKTTWPVARVGAFEANAWYTLRVLVRGDGVFAVWLAPRGQFGQEPVWRDLDPVFATGAALASGKSGLYDEQTAATAATRDYDNLWFAEPSLDAVIFSDRSARLQHEAAVRSNEAGTAEGDVPTFEGEHLTLPPATRAGRTSRIVVKARRLDCDSGLPCKGHDDSLVAELVATPRVLLLGT